MNLNYDYPEWAKAEKLEMCEPLCELWMYSDKIVKSKSVLIKIMIRKKVSWALYQLADLISVKEISVKEGAADMRMKYQ